MNPSKPARQAPDTYQDKEKHRSWSDTTFETLDIILAQSRFVSAPRDKVFRPNKPTVIRR